MEEGERRGEEERTGESEGRKKREEEKVRNRGSVDPRSPCILLRKRLTFILGSRSLRSDTEKYAKRVANRADASVKRHARFPELVRDVFRQRIASAVNAEREDRRRDHVSRRRVTDNDKSHSDPRSSAGMCRIKNDSGRKNCRS